jgi:hypothetical protein
LQEQNATTKISTTTAQPIEHSNYAPENNKSSAGTQLPDGATVLSLDTATLLEVLKNANTVLTPYAEAEYAYESLDNLAKWVNAEMKQGAFPTEGGSPDLEDYGWTADELTEYNHRRQIWKGMGGFLTGGKLGGSAIDMSKYKNRRYFAANCAKKVNEDIAEAKRELVAAEQNLPAQNKFVMMIPEKYRNPFPISEMITYLEDCRAENWKEAVNLFEQELAMNG